MENSSITDWLKTLIEELGKTEVNDKVRNTIEITPECMEGIIGGLKNLDEYVTWLRQAYDKEITAK
jgi:hypothetical protein